MTSGRYTKGTKKYVSASLGGSGFSAGDNILLVVFSLGSINPAYPSISNDSVIN